MENVKDILRKDLHTLKKLLAEERLKNRRLKIEVSGLREIIDKFEFVTEENIEAEFKDITHHVDSIRDEQ